MVNKIYLRLIIEDGVKKVVDQDGRELEGVIAVESRSAIDEIDTLTVTTYQYSAAGEPILRGGNPL